MDPPQPLRERKRLQAKERIIQAAEDLFSEQGFDQTTVDEIAERAEVGRTTFFRYFGDKQEVVFATEEELVAAITDEYRHSPANVTSDAAEAIAQLREVVLALCAKVTQDPIFYRHHVELVDKHVELRAREAIKLQRLTDLLEEFLTLRGADHSIALLASQIALACYQTGRSLSEGDPSALVSATRGAFDRVLKLGKSRTTRSGTR